MHPKETNEAVKLQNLIFSSLRSSRFCLSSAQMSGEAMRRMGWKQQAAIDAVGRLNIFRLP